MKNIPFQASPIFSETIVLGGSVWILRFIWNSRWKYWTMSVGNVDGTIIDGLVLVPGLFLLNSHSKDLLPAGDFALLSPNSSLAPVSMTNIGDDLDYLLVYMEAEEIVGLV